MRAVFDALFVTLFFRPSANVHHPIGDAPERVAHLIETLSEQNAKIIIPTPVLGEFLMLAREDGPLYLASMQESDVFQIESYDERAAVEAAALMIKAKDEGDKRAGAKGNWQTIKIDWQIAAIAKVHRADVLYSDDNDLVQICDTAGLRRKGIADLPVAPKPEIQLSLDPEEPPTLIKPKPSRGRKKKT